MESISIIQKVRDNEMENRGEKTFLIGLVHCGCRTRDCCYPRSQAVLAFSTSEPTCQTRRLQPPKEDPQFTRLSECNYFSANPENFRDGHKNTQDEDEVQFTVSKCPISIKSHLSITILAGSSSTVLFGKSKYRLVSLPPPIQSRPSRTECSYPLALRRGNALLSAHSPQPRGTLRMADGWIVRPKSSICLRHALHQPSTNTDRGVASLYFAISDLRSVTTFHHILSSASPRQVLS